MPQRHPVAQDARITAVLDVICEAARVGEPDAGECQALLALEVRDLFGGPVPKCVRLTRSKAGFEQAWHISRFDGTIGEARARDLHFDQGLEPQQASRAVAREFDG